MGNRDKQNLAISGMIKNLKIKRKRTKDQDKPDKNKFDYILKDPVDTDIKHHVCRQALMNIFGIGDTRVRTITSSRANDSLNLPRPDQRGRCESYIK